MEQEKKSRLERDGWVFGTAEEFLNDISRPNDLPNSHSAEGSIGVLGSDSSPEDNRQGAIPDDDDRQNQANQ